MKTVTIFRPSRLLFIVPVVLLAVKIDDPWVSLFFVIVLSWVTSKMFPVIEIASITEEKDGK